VPSFAFVYPVLMHTFQRCAEPGCSSLCFHGSTRCLAHHPDPLGASAAVQALLAEKGSKDINAAGMAAEGLDLSRRKFIGCSFIGASFRNVLFTGSTFLLCFFDRARFEACDFSGANVQFGSFGASEIVNVSFESAELIHCNFDGSKIRETTFSGSNLYDSRFIRGEIDHCDFENCDLKRVYFIPAMQSGVSFKGSNTMEAIRDLEHLYR
jgi:uncharacterized protein YjbI with pentapeptide repeats